MSNFTEKQKMRMGEPYVQSDPELIADRNRAKQLCFQISQTCPTDRTKHRQLLSQIIAAETDAWVEPPFYCDYGYNIRLGRNFYANHGCVILDCAPVTIGDNCLFGPSVVIAAPGHPFDPVARANGDEFAKPITIGDNVWLGANVTVCPGVQIGENVIVGAGSVVIRDLAANAIYAGVPAVKIRDNFQTDNFQTDNLQTDNLQTGNFQTGSPQTSGELSRE